MNKFEEYCASWTTSTMTLLERQNLIIKFLKENPTYNVYSTTEEFETKDNYYEIENVDNRFNKLKIGDAIMFQNGYIAFVESVGEERYLVGNAFNLRGPQGPQGPKGEKGEKGEGATINKYTVSGYISEMAMPTDNLISGTIYSLETIVEGYLSYDKILSFRLTTYPEQGGMPSEIYFLGNETIYAYDMMGDVRKFEYAGITLTSVTKRN